MARRVRGAGGISEVTLPEGWVLAEGDTVVISDAEWDQIAKDPALSLRVDDLGSTTDAVDPVPTWRDIQRKTSTGDIGLEAQIDAVATDLATHEGDTTDVHGIPDTSLLETIAGAQSKADTALATADANLSLHAAQTTNVHGIADTSNLAEDDIPSLTLIFENGLI